MSEQASAFALPVPSPPPKTNKSTGKRAARRPQPGVTHASRLPSAHTLRTFLAGLKHGMTVLTNNRGAVGKVTREMGISEGIAYGREDAKGKAVVWVVNPSSLSEWRRRGVEKKNQVFLEANGDLLGPLHCYIGSQFVDVGNADRAQDSAPVSTTISDHYSSHALKPSPAQRIPP
ncbi:uncharacterized protein L203_104920 [Cryptococcus depauperatus CBS 7841]|uniref:Uncharacterized protein n=1 Tax=Cryptococcus depauperatus CBS 7841 TaxID=1295531 RepID=A0A1E3IMY1_9TREE|nr:hypothetical protein L203_01869 [Cryptococcus depauperatus CBS 7841]